MSKFLWVSGKTPDNVLEGIRTPDPRLRRPLLYSTLSYETHIVIEIFITERVMGIESHVSSLEGWCSTMNYTAYKSG